METIRRILAALRVQPDDWAGYNALADALTDRGCPDWLVSLCQRSAERLRARKDRPRFQPTHMHAIVSSFVTDWLKGQSS